MAPHAPADRDAGTAAGLAECVWQNTPVTSAAVIPCTSRATARPWLRAPRIPVILPRKLRSPLTATNGVCVGRRSALLGVMRGGYSSSTRLPATRSNAPRVGGYGERKLPTTTSSASEPADQPKSVSWVMLRPPLTDEKSPLAMLPCPPLTDALIPLAVLPAPSPVLGFNPPLLTAAANPLAVF
jgi:hypothetical protein